MTQEIAQFLKEAKKAFLVDDLPHGNVGFYKQNINEVYNMNPAMSSRFKCKIFLFHATFTKPDIIMVVFEGWRH